VPDVQLQNEAEGGVHGRSALDTNGRPPRTHGSLGVGPAGQAREIQCNRDQAKISIPRCRH
jgi:hypothetical protein